MTDWLINFIGVSFRLIGIVTFKKALDHFPLSIATVVWFGVTFVLPTALDVLLFKTALNYKIMFFMGLCIISIIGLNYSSPAK